MENVSLDDIRQWTNAEVVGILHGHLEVKGVSTDTRTLRPGDIFLALSGPSFNGRDYVTAAFEQGACAAVVEGAGQMPDDGPVLVVPSVVRALGDMARAYRRRFDLPVIAVVGSAGKTTTKEMVVAVLARRFCVFKTPANENNEIGVPRALLSLDSSHEVAVLELGARQVGDIAYLCGIAQPGIGILLNIGTAHLEVFGTVERVAKAKGELLDYLDSESSVALVNADDCVIAKETMRTKGRLLGFSLKQESRFCGEGLTLDQGGCGHFSLQHIDFDLKVPGRHNVYNALAAIAAGSQLGVTAAEAAIALRAFEPVALRSQILRKNGICVINDSYNANPESMHAALELLANWDVGNGRRIAVVGDMLELGTEGPRLHETVGEVAAESGVDIFLATGLLGRHAIEAARRKGLTDGAARHFADRTGLGRYASEIVQPGDVVLVKASRGVGLDAIVDQLLDCTS
jgi:UDP-N-acetylmuramoyl-tripeptide--D-alanyl-D-alanine ligase